MYSIDTTKGTQPSEIKRQGQEPGKKEVTTMTTMNAAATTSYNAAAQNIKVNDKKRTLEISKTFEKAASRFGSDEYNALKKAQMEMLEKISAITQEEAKEFGFSNKKDNLQAWYESREKAAQTAMKKLIEQFESVEN